MEQRPPYRRNAAETRQRILDAAREAFARRGFDGARVDAIAAAACVNKQMLYHYFGSKDALFTVVLENAYRDIRGREAALGLSHLRADRAILKLVEFTWNYYLEHPEFIRLLNSENQLEARHLKESPHTAEINSGHLARMRELIDRGRKEGVVRAGLDPVQLSITIAALGFFYLINRHTLSTVFERDLGAPAALDERLRVMKDVMQRWIRPRAEVVTATAAGRW